MQCLTNNIFHHYIIVGDEQPVLRWCASEGREGKRITRETAREKPSSLHKYSIQLSNFSLGLCVSVTASFVSGPTTAAPFFPQIRTALVGALLYQCKE